jgi:hypothetical protein
MPAICVTGTDCHSFGLRKSWKRTLPNVISFTARIADEGVEGMLSQDNGSDAASMSIMNGVMKAGKNGLQEYYAVGI